MAERHGVFLPHHFSLVFLPHHSAPYFSVTSLCSIQSSVSLYSHGEEVYSTAYVSINRRQHNVADVFSIVYKLVDSWYRSIIGFILQLMQGFSFQTQTQFAQVADLLH